MTFKIKHIPDLDESWQLEVNDIKADAADFGEISHYNDQWGEPMGNTFEAYSEPEEDVISKYDITIDEFREIANTLEDECLYDESDFSSPWASSPWIRDFGID